MYKRNIDARSRKNFCHAKARSVTYFQQVSVALVIQHDQRMRRIVICGLSGSTLFYTLPNKRHNFRRKFSEREMCVLRFFTRFV